MGLEIGSTVLGGVQAGQELSVSAGIICREVIDVFSMTSNALIG